MKRRLGLLVLFVLTVGGALLMSSQIHNNRYQEPGWQISLPAGWVTEQGRVKDAFSEKAVYFSSAEATQQEVETWVNEVTSKTTIIRPVALKDKDGLRVYSFSGITTQGKQFVGPGYDGVKSMPVYLVDRAVETYTAVVFDGINKYTFSSQDQINSADFDAVIASFKAEPISKQISSARVTQLAIFVPGASTKVMTMQENKDFINNFVAAFNEAEVYRQDVGKAYPVLITLTLKDGSQIEISGGAFDFQTIRINNREFNVRGAKLQNFFTL
jgi:hypothetical protein